MCLFQQQTNIPSAEAVILMVHLFHFLPPSERIILAAPSPTNSTAQVSIHNRLLFHFTAMQCTLNAWDGCHAWQCAHTNLQTNIPSKPSAGQIK
jgi:hypothetical protein